jgi:2',3'-cyclic-nucleotide 2'-phosphodiesterase (5'-nucleotidase family)
MKKVKCLIFIPAILLTVCCAQKHYTVKSVEGSRVEMNSDWDAKGDSKMDKLVRSFKTKLDDAMNQKIGVAAQNLAKGLPQGLLNNFAADAMQDYGTELWGAIDFAVINNGGIRTSIAEGPVTVGHIFEVFPFENSFVLIELPGKAVKEFFDFVADHGGEGLSKGIELVIKDKAVYSLKIGGQPLDENKTYRIATINYLAEGNDKMTALKQATKYIDSNMMIRDVIIEYIKDLTAAHKPIDAKSDNRIKNLLL